MFKTLIIMVLGASAGLVAGWTMHQARYGSESKFGPFSMDSDVDATNVASYLKAKVQSGSPRIEVVGGEEFDFGVMEPGSKGEHVFVVRNAGDYPMTLEIVGSTCKCTIGELKKSTLEPGEQTDIKLTWDVQAHGEEFGQSAILKTNDPTRGELHLKVKGRVISQMTMEPRSFAFGDVESGETIKLESVIYSFQKQPIVPTTPSFSDESMSELATWEVEEIEVDASKNPAYASATQAFKVSGEVRPGLPQGAVQQNFVFAFVDKADMDAEGKFDEADVLKFFVPVAGKIVGPITMLESAKCTAIDGGYVYKLGRVDPATAKPERANIMLRGKYKDSVKLSLGEVEPAGLLKAELGEPVGRGAVLLYPLRLWLDPEAKTGERLGKNDDDYGVVWIQTDNPDVSPLRLRVVFTVTKP
ncbi:MAG: DUF1573 domain-containing protein [Planctomycetaceae bacterium]